MAVLNMLPCCEGSCLWSGGEGSLQILVESRGNTCLFCEEEDIAPLNIEEFLLLEAIKKAGSAVHVRIGGANIFNPHYVRAVIHYKGMLKENGLHMEWRF